jgi:uncharacterized repeat protein (TIGR01451 family)
MIVRASVVLILTFIGSLLCTWQAKAQLKITFPVSRLVVQRNNNNQATVQIAGSYSQPLESIEARVVARVAGQGTSTNWAPLQNNPINGQFNGSLTVQGGWYQVEVRGLSGGGVVASDVVDRFGVGEVFAIMGHSNAQGSSCYVDGTNRCPTTNGPSDDRVTIVALDQSSSDFQNYLNTADTRYLPGLAFSQLLTNSGMSPFASISWLWGPMGDALVQRINVPVLLYNAGFGGTNMQQTYWAAYDIPFQHSFVRYDLRMPYVNTRNLMNLYVPTTGLRAILVQHGENDRTNPADSTYKYYGGFIDKVRNEFSKPNLAFIVAISSYVGARFDNVRQPQFQTIGRPGYLAFQGPDLDNINSLDDRPDGLHFSPSGQTKAGQAWASAISDSYLSTINPYLAETQPVATIACATSNQLLLTQPGGFQYNWNTGSTGNSVTVGIGTYSARLKSPQNKIYFPPAVVVPANVQPGTPTIATDNGTSSICQSTGLTLTSSYAGANNWSTGSSAQSILVTKPGAYTLQARNLVYGCLSDVVSRTIDLAPVDLGLSLQTARRIVAVNDTVSFWLTVQNKGGCDAGAIGLQSRLPPNVSFVSASDLSTLNNIVIGTIGNLVPGGIITRRYTARLTAEGAYFPTAELTASVNPIPNVTLNNGTANGEEDETQTDVRAILTSTTAASGNVYVSPNPNQGPLPPVQQNQPAPEADKADLSLSVQLSSLAVQPGASLSITLTVQNRGGLAATNVALTDVLPAGLLFVTSSSGMSATGSAVNGTISQIPVGQSASLSFVVQVTGSGMFTNKAQIMSVDQPDSDSTPGNGYTNGEDDQANTYIRTSG